MTSVPLYLFKCACACVVCVYQLRQLALEEGMESKDHFHTWIQYCHDRGIVYCDLPPTATVATTNCQNSEGTDIMVVLQPLMIVEACRTLLSPASSCCFKVLNPVFPHILQSFGSKMNRINCLGNRRVFFAYGVNNVKRVALIC